MTRALLQSIKGESHSKEIKVWVRGVRVRGLWGEGWG